MNGRLLVPSCITYSSTTATSRLLLQTVCFLLVRQQGFSTLILVRRNRTAVRLSTTLKLPLHVAQLSANLALHWSRDTWPGQHAFFCFFFFPLLTPPLLDGPWKKRGWGSSPPSVCRKGPVRGELRSTNATLPALLVAPTPPAHCVHDRTTRYGATRRRPVGPRTLHAGPPRQPGLE